MSEPRPANRLAGETSPYLLQHAHNPVDWWPWGPDALARATLLDRPIFLSIGYAACHWCHVMERESFEDEATARFLNAHFIPIKVDREERPDLDSLYMSAVQALTGQGGWPMSVFLTPNGRPFWGGTYFPDRPRHGMPSFGQVLEGIARAWREDRGNVERAAAQVVGHLADQQRTAPVAGGLPEDSVLEAAARGIGASFDAVNGGWGQAPKFPQPMTIEFLLRRAVAGDADALAVARRSLRAMADGGIRDQLGGGFHRYSTTADWLVPHFEQMLYDNAQLLAVYAHAWALTEEPAWLDVALGVVGYLERELRTAEGGFAASQDADTEGEEGGTFVWTAAEVREVVGAGAPLFDAAYGVTEAGNWEGHTILSRVRSDEALAAEHGLAASDVAQRLEAARARLSDRRAERPQPARDDKVLAGWNGLAIAALADLAGSLRAAGDPSLEAAADRCLRLAIGAAEAVVGGLLGADERLRRSWKDGRATADGVLEDHALLGDGLLALFEATGDGQWFEHGRRLADAILVRFADPAGGFFDTASDAERLIARPKDLQDNALPAGGSAAARLLLRLAALTGDARYRDAAEAALATVAPILGRYPTAFANWLVALDFALAPVIEVAIVGDPDGADTRALVDVARRGFRPHQVVAPGDGSSGLVPLLRDRPRIDGRATAYVCRGFTCRLPVTTPEALVAELDSVRSAPG